MYVSSGPLDRTYVRRLTNIRLPSRSGFLGRLASDLVIRGFRAGYFVYFKLNGGEVIRSGVGKIVSRKYKFILFMIPKVATSSFLSLFLKSPEMDFEAYRTREPVGSIFPDRQEFEAYYKFAFVRNPWARVVSCYNDKINNVNKINKVTIIAKYPGLKPGMSFADFVRWLCSEEGRDEIADPHWRSQSEILSDQYGRIPLDFIGRLESLEEDLERIRDQVSLPRVPLPRRNVGNKTSKSSRKSERLHSYSEYYTDETRDLIAQRYKNDIEAFGYTF